MLTWHKKYEYRIGPFQYKTILTQTQSEQTTARIWEGLEYILSRDGARPGDADAQILLDTLSFSLRQSGLAGLRSHFCRFGAFFAYTLHSSQALSA